MKIKTPMESSLLMTIEEAAETLRLGRTFTYGLVMDGKLQSIKIGRRRLVMRTSLKEFIDRTAADQIDSY